MRDETVNEAIQASLKAEELVSGRPTTEATRNAVIARMGLHGELGYLEDGGEAVYSLDDDTRDRLIVHARQDAAHALLNTVSTLNALGTQKWILRLLLVAVLLLAYIALRVS